MLANENRFNQAPDAGHAYELVTVAATYSGAKAKTNGFDLSFKVVGGQAVSYDAFSCKAFPKDSFDISTDVFPGGTVTGSLCFDVAEADLPSLVLYVRSGFTGDDVFFALV